MARYRMGLIIVAVFVLGAVAGALVLTAFQRGSPPATHAQSTDCSNASFAGTYGERRLDDSLAAAGGSSSQAPPQGDVVLIVRADGAGGLTVRDSMDMNPITGSYRVNPDCSFTVAIAGPSGSAGGAGNARAFGVLVNDGKRFYVAATTPSQSAYFVGERQ